MDDVNVLPITGQKNTPPELAILQQYFATHGSSPSVKTEFGVKESLYATLLFIVMANPVVDHIIGYIPHTGSSLIRAGIKAIIYFVFLYVIFLKM